MSARSQTIDTAFISSKGVLSAKINSFKPIYTLPDSAVRVGIKYVHSNGINQATLDMAFYNSTGVEIQGWQEFIKGSDYTTLKPYFNGTGIPVFQFIGTKYNLTFK
jgi:hypothetical protein